MFVQGLALGAELNRENSVKSHCGYVQDTFGHFDWFYES
jgi:hypothetical protein